LYNAAISYGKKPSQFFDFETELGAWQLDEACLVVGRQVENNLSNGRSAFDGFVLPVSTKSKGYAAIKGKYPVRKMKVPANGIW
jgi:hypothetical protein